mmetsp:Transcript_2300/g.6804  ORF Transcript_2300/g.6804 Transcript_2300/m.6804 type:complete len:228 (-) Transcript_2300:337-1020(-)
MASLSRFSCSLSLMVFCSSPHFSFSMLRLISWTSTSPSTAFLFSTRSALASRSTASLKSRWKSAILVFCVTTSPRTPSRPVSSSTRLASWNFLNCWTSSSRRTKPCSVLTKACCMTSTLATVRTMWSSISSRLTLLWFCSSRTPDMSLSSFSIVKSQWSAFRASSCTEPIVAISTWLSRRSITFFVMLDTPFAFVHRRSGTFATALGMIGWSSCAMMPSCRLEKNLL